MRIRPRRCRRRAFTLVELVTAAALMSMMMVGVIEVFTIITETAAEAEALSFSQQQLRGLFDKLHRDMRGLTREGYLKIDANYCDRTSNPAQGTSMTTTAYATHSLRFVSIGSWEGVFESRGETYGTAAEVCYTANVTYVPGQPAYFRQVQGRSQKEDIRRGVIARGAWIITGTPGTGGDVDDASQARSLAQIFTGDQPGRAREYVYVSPWLEGQGLPDEPETLRRALATCAGEFFVEYWDEKSGGDGEWKSETRDWSAGSPDWPKAIRVTASVYDPEDTSRPEVTRSSSGQIVAEQRHRGYALQEVYWIGDP